MSTWGKAARATRGTLRRGIRLGCELMTDDGARRETLVDLSADGARVATSASLVPGAEVLLTFGMQRLGRRIEALGRVAHVESRGHRASSIGVEFLELDEGVRDALAQSLRNVPPPLPRRGGSVRP